jgi:mono/diheme cytochrome c family protein
MRNVLLGIGVPLLLLAAIQLVPYGREHAPPAAGRAVAWDSPATLALARRACFDCHSNQTRWPWYASIAPFSWRIQTDVNLARKKLDFTAFDPGNARMAAAAGRSAETVRRGDMPPQDYIMVHAAARLNAADKQALAAGLDSTFGKGMRIERGRLP